MSYLWLTYISICKGEIKVSISEQIFNTLSPYFCNRKLKTGFPFKLQDYSEISLENMLIQQGDYLYHGWGFGGGYLGQGGTMIQGDQKRSEKIFRIEVFGKICEKIICFW